MPAFTSLTTSFTVTDFVGRVERREFVVNRNYQRSDSVWPTAARSFLIESILLGYPIPKLSIRQITDVVTRSTTSEIVDGQQRTKAIVDYYNNAFALSKNSEVDGADGCYYDDLTDVLKQQFLSFSIQADVLTGARDKEIIELFRRINSNTVSLNKEEQRHARYQGAMKWLVYKIAQMASPLFERFHVFSVKQFSRMADAKLVAEVIHALMYGVSTTTARKLDTLYSENNGPPDQNSNVYFQPRPRDEGAGGVYPGSVEVTRRFADALEAISEMEELVDTSMMKPFNVYSLLLALMHAVSTIDTIPIDLPGGQGLAPPDRRQARLLELSQVMDLDDDEAPRQGDDRKLWEAASKSTNTAVHRLDRFAAFLKAVRN